MARRKSTRGQRLSAKTVKKFAERMRHKLTKTELMFLRRLTLGNVGSFDFQIRIGFYIVDFVFPSKMLIIELDGPSHGGREEHDAQRDAWLATAGFTTWRIPNSEAASWPLQLITKHERSSEGRGYVDAVQWANGQHERAHGPLMKRTDIPIDDPPDCVPTSRPKIKTQSKVRWAIEKAGPLFPYH